MKTLHILALIRGALGLLEKSWEQVSGHTHAESFMVIRFEGITKGHLRRIHSLVEDLLAGELGEGDRE